MLYSIMYRQDTFVMWVNYFNWTDSFNPRALLIQGCWINKRCHIFNDSVFVTPFVQM